MIESQPPRNQRRSSGFQPEFTRPGWPSYESALLALTFAAVVVIAAWPLVAGFLRAVHEGLGSQWDLIRDSSAIFGRSLFIAGSTTLAATLLGLGAAISLDRVAPRLRPLLYFALALTFFVPEYIAAVAWIEIAGAKGELSRLLQWVGLSDHSSTWIYSPAGVVLVQSLGLFPVVAFLAAAGLRAVDRGYREAAAIHVSHRRYLTGIAWPFVRPFIAAGAFFVFLFASASFAAPSLLQVRVYATEIHQRFNAFHDVAGGFALAIPPVMLCVFLAVLLLRRAPSSSDWRSVFSSSPVAPHLQNRNPIPVVYLSMILCASLAVPLGVLLVRSFPLSSYAAAWRTARGDIATSLLIAAAASAILTLLGLATAATATRFPRSGNVLAALVATFAISGPALGIGMILAWNHPGFRGLVYDSLAILVLANVARYFFFAYVIARAGTALIDERLIDAARVAAISPWRQFIGVTLPLAAPCVALLSGFLFLQVLGDVETAVLLTPPGYTTVPVRVFGLMHYGPSRLVAALSVIMLLIIALGAGLTTLAARAMLRSRYGLPAHH